MKTVPQLPTGARFGASIVAMSILVLGAGVVPAAAVTIDDFSTAQAQLSAPPDAASNQGGGGILGGQRDLELTVLSGAGPATVEVTGGELQLRVTDTPAPDSRGRTIVTWDGDTDPGTLDSDGLLGVDLTTGGHTGFRLTVEAAGAGAEVVFNVHTDASNASRAALVLPAVATTTTIDLSFSSFAASLGAGADFANVGAITMSVTSVEQDVDIAMLETVGPAVVAGDALKTDTLLIDNDGDGRADPGDTLRYTITITNTGSEATSVNLDDLIQPNLTVVADSLFTDPIAAPDTYIACGNVTLAVDGSPGLPGVTDNDHDPDGETFSITTTFPLATDRGGAIDNVDANTGTFDYVPPAGFRGVDGFSYEIQDLGGRTTTARVTLMVDSLVWFVDNTAAAGGSGQQASPFDNLNDAETASGPGDIIFVHAGSGDTGDGITLKDGQQLIGEGVGLNACGTTIVPAGTRPTIVNPTSTVVTLADGNGIAGLNIEPQGSEDAIVGNLVDGLTMIQVGIDTSRGAAGNGGVSLTDATGAVVIDQLTIAGVGTGNSFGVFGGDPQITVTSSSFSPSAGGLLRVVGMTGGSVDFAASTSLSLTGGTADAALLQNNAATISIATLGDLTTGSGGGLLVSNSGALNLGATGSISATGGPAIDITSTTVTGSLALTALTSANSGGAGVRLSGVGSGLSVSGATTVAGPVGDGILLVGANGPVSFTTVAIDGPGGNGLSVSGNTATVAVNGGSIGAMTVPTGDGVDIFGGSAGITIAASINGSPAAHSVDVDGRTGGPVSFTGAVADPGMGVDLTSNGAGTVNFSGGLDLDTTTNQAFTATGGGTVNITGTNTIDTTTGTALRVENTNIGASGLTFQSVSSNGATNGIVLNATGTTGGLTVTGTGSTSGSGGTIQTAVDAVSLTDTSMVTLGNINLTLNSDSAITGSNVTDLILNNVSVSMSGNAAGESGIDLTNLRGLANAITNSTITASATAERAVSITNTVGTGTADVLTVTGSTIQDTYDSPVGADLLEIGLSGSANFDATISNSTFADGRTTGIQMLVSGTAVGDLDVSGCTMTNQGIGIDMGVVGSGSLTFDVSSNPAITARPGYGTTMVNLFTDDTASAEGRVNNNPNIRSGGAGTSGFGIRFNVNGNSNATVEAINNTISDINFDIGIDAVARGGTGGSAGRLDATITGNNVTVDAIYSLYDIRTQAQNDNTVCANVANNTASGVAIAAYRERTSNAGSTVFLEGFNTNAVSTWTDNGNTPAGSVSENNNGTLSGPPGGTCVTVP